MAKILVLGSHAESLIIFRFDMLKALAQDHEVIACIPDAPTAEANHNVQQKLAAAGIGHVSVQLARTGLNPFFDLITIFSLYKTFKKIRPDLIFAYTGKPVIFGSIAAKLAGVPRIYSMITGLGSYFIHTDFKTRVVHKIMSTLYKIALAFNTKVFFQNPDDVADFARHKIFNDPQRTVLTNGSGVNLVHFTEM
ncbi:MAG TPA: glycosyltransferase, partial [Gammaproteobacteria bacterium]|nr:glycosyltransferase [Gammaproteobacteria bacterium]